MRYYHILLFLLFSASFVTARDALTPPGNLLYSRLSSNTTPSEGGNSSFNQILTDSLYYPLNSNPLNYSNSTETIYDGSWINNVIIGNLSIAYNNDTYGHENIFIAITNNISGLSSGSSSVWDNTSNNATIMIGKVGIGITTPSSTLTILGNLTVSGTTNSSIDDGLLFIDAANGYVGINNTQPAGLLHVANGLINHTMNASTTLIEGYVSNPFISIGYSQNLLLQSESFATTWVRKNITILTNNDAISPIGTLIAERMIGNISNPDAGIQQSVANATLGWFTFSVWINSHNNNNPSPTIRLKLDTNAQSTDYVNVTLSRQWKRYSVTQYFSTAHTTKIAYIIIGDTNISVWGAQLEPGTTARPYGAARTTTANLAETGLIYSRLPITSAGAISAAGVAVGGTLSGASTGAFSGAITHTSAPAFVSTDGIVITSTTAATLAAPVQLSPRTRYSGTVWDMTAGASRTVNFKEEVISIPGTPGTAKMVWGYGYNSVADIDINQLMSLNSIGSLDVYGNTYGLEVLNNSNFTEGSRYWNTNGGWQINVTTQNMSRYQFSLGANGNLSQNNTLFKTPLKPNRWYKLSYNISGTGVAGCVAYINGNTTSQGDMYLPGVSVITAGQLYDINFKTNNNPSNFTITARCTAGSFYLDTLYLREITSGNIIANGLLTGGGNDGIKIDEYGKVGIGTISLTQKLDINGSLNITGNIYITNTTTTESCIYLPGGGKLCGNTTCSLLYSPNGITILSACNS